MDGVKVSGKYILGGIYMQNKYAVLSYQGLSGLYTLGLSLWTGTIYLYMQQVGYSYGQINLFLALFGW